MENDNQNSPEKDFQQAGELLTQKQGHAPVPWKKLTLLAIGGLAACWGALKLQSGKPSEIQDEHFSVCLEEQGIFDAKLAFVPRLHDLPAVLLERKEMPYRSRDVKTFTYAIVPDGNVFVLNSADNWHADITGHMEPHWKEKGRMIVPDSDPNHADWEGPLGMESKAVRRCFIRDWSLR